MKRLAERTSKRTENISPRARRRACLQRLLNMMAPPKAFAVAVPDKRDLVVLHPLPLGSKSSKDEELSCNKQCAMQIMSSFELGGHHGATAAIGCGFNWWMQHTSRYGSGRSVADEAQAAHLLLGKPEVIDLGPLAEGTDASPDCRTI